MIKQRKRLAPTASVAYLFDVAVGSVRRWASEDGWTPYGTRRHRLWDLNQAQASYDRRHPKPEPACRPASGERIVPDVGELSP